MKMKRGLQGSITVEASLVMVVLLTVIFLILQMTLFLTDVVRMDALITEDSTYLQEEEAERNLWFDEKGNGFFFLQASDIRRSAGDQKVTVSYEEYGINLGFHRREDVSKQVERKSRKPVSELRMIRMLTDMGD